MDHGTMVDLPDTMVDLPNTIVYLPNTMVDLPNTMVDLPNTMVNLPNTMGDLPNTMVDFLNTMVGPGRANRSRQQQARMHTVGLLWPRAGGPTASLRGDLAEGQLACAVPKPGRMVSVG